jgi:DNA-binding PadR family transcriptional regulator
MRMTANEVRVCSTMLRVSGDRCYGYELMKATGLRTASMYKCLHRLRDRGWLDSFMESGDPKVLGRRKRRYYAFTQLGETAVRDNIRDWIDQLRTGGQAA